jgi:hypothetical protein
LVAVVDSAYDERLHNAARDDGPGELFEGFLAEARSRLIGARVDEVYVNVIEPISL